MSFCIQGYHLDYVFHIFKDMERKKEKLTLKTPISIYAFETPPYISSIAPSRQNQVFG